MNALNSQLVFSVVHRTCALPVGEIAHITNVVAFQTVPGIESPLLGVCLFHGENLFGIDLAPILGIPGHVYDPGAYMLLVRREGYLFGVLADIIGTVIPAEEMNRLELSPSRDQHGCILDMFQHENTLIHRVDPWLALSRTQRRALQGLRIGAARNHMGVAS